MRNPSPKKESASASLSGLFGTVCCLCICATICFIVYFLKPHAQPVRRLWTPVLAGTNGSTTFLGDTRQMEFWTPSVKTRDYVRKDHGDFIPSEKWEVISNDDPILKFGAMLGTNPSVVGYRRVEVWGQGRTGFKAGWWWTVNVLTNYSAEDLGTTYQTFWKSPHPVFAEVIDNRGSGE